MLRSLSGLLLSAPSYLRVVFVLLGAALALALGIAGFTVLSLISEAGTPPWAVVLIGVVLVGGPLMVGVVPAVRQIEGAAVQTLLVVQFRDGPPRPGAELVTPADAGMVPPAPADRGRPGGRGYRADRAGRRLVDDPGGGGGIAGRAAAGPAARRSSGRPCSGRPTRSGWSGWRPTLPAHTNVIGLLVRSTTASGMPCRW